ncbi:MAG: uracil-DNA glycosylase [Mesorhizobium sp.]|uniref:uracil-DNA glycosylase n=1 Tax=Mesorhizobium sp. TaxID=1871066 RepID=UPI00120BC337|nr:uracil-DNA glycosylase [Mesorhizobium sp.]TIM28431.1 MAG: uracil-DNA glycosylase [Mesorhizobium sp.]
MTAVSRDDRSDIADLLAFYASAGVDEALEEEPLNRFAEAASKPLERAPATVTPPTGENAALPRSTSLSRAGMGERQATAPAVRAPSGTATVPDEQQAALARHLATTAATLDELRQHMAAFDGCNLKFTAKNLVFADGNPNAAVMLVGEAPGRDEDIEGLPFVGRSGRLLDRMLAAIGLDRTSAYIANVIPWRPPGNRTPTPHETEICRPFIERQIELVNPKVLVNLGGPSASTLLNTTEGILRLRGNWRVHTTAAGIAIPAMPTLHPAYLLRTPAHKKLAWRDFLEVKAKLRALG